MPPTHETGMRMAWILTRTWLLLFLVTPCTAQEAETLVVGTKQAAPFSFRSDDGLWRGISIDLWRGIADDLGLQFELREASIQDLIEGLEDGRFDASVAALTVTSEREQRVDFTHPFHPSGLGIAVPAEHSKSLWATLTGLLSVRFFQAVASLAFVLFLGGFLLWFFERKRNPEQFGGTLSKGLGAAFWWSAVTMTTVGYGDKSPTTVPGRLVAIIWMFASIIMISGLTAAIASTLTVSQLGASVNGPRDLATLGRVGCVSGSTGEQYLRKQRLPSMPFETAARALEALGERRMKAVVYDAPILRYLALTEFEDSVTVLPVTFERQDYAIALPLDSSLRKAINKALLERVSSESWQDVLYTYLGTQQ